MAPKRRREPDQFFVVCFHEDEVRCCFEGFSELRTIRDKPIKEAPKVGDDITAPFGEYYYRAKVVRVCVDKPTLSTKEIRGTTAEERSKKEKAVERRTNSETRVASASAAMENLTRVPNLTNPLEKEVARLAQELQAVKALLANNRNGASNAPLVSVNGDVCLTSLFPTVLVSPTTFALISGESLSSAATILTRQLFEEDTLKGSSVAGKRKNLRALDEERIGAIIEYCVQRWGCVPLEELKASSKSISNFSPGGDARYVVAREVTRVVDSICTESRYQRKI